MRLHLRRGIFIISILAVAMIAGVSCASTKRTSVQDQRRGLLMLEGENVYKNKGFYKEKKSAKRRKKVKRASKRKYKRR
jgi:hypothetical protein